jgi:hypothetical protein
MAELKLTTKGEMEVTGIYLKKNIVDAGAGVQQESVASNAWYNMKTVISPTLHINDKVRIHSRITILERNWTGNTQNGNPAAVAPGNVPDGSINNNGLDYRGSNHLWVEHFYMSFPLFGGTLNVGRMSGGGWAYPFSDNADNRDRILWTKKFGHNMVGLLIEKLGEGDGGTPLTTVQAGSRGFSTSHSDTNAYALLGVIPFSKNIVWKPLFYYIDLQGTPATQFLTSQGLMIKGGPFKLDTEIIYTWFDAPNAVGGRDWTEDQWAWWLDAGVTFGPAEIAAGFWWMEGSDSNNARNAKSFLGTGGEFQPLYLLYSEDAGLLFSTTGVANGSVGGTSGYLGIFLRGSYKISDSMKIDGILAYVQADEMCRRTHYDGIRAAGDELGWEFDLNFEWKFLPNIKYVAGFAYLDAGDYWREYRYGGNAAGTSVDNNVWGLHHGLVINW